MITDSTPQLQEQVDALRADLQRLRDQLAGAVGLPSPGTNGQMLYTNAALPYWGNPPTAIASINVSSPITSTGGTTPTIGHATSGVSAGSYSNVNLTVNASGHITAISNGSASVNWGSIGGSLASQTDLQAALNAKGGLSSANTWTSAQTYGTVFDYRYFQNSVYSLGSTSPASTSTWYRVAEIPHTDYGQEATIYLRFHRASGNGEAFYKFVLSKATYDGVTGTQFWYQQAGRYNSAYGILEARVVEAASPNVSSYLDVRMKTTDALTMNMMANTVCAGYASATLLGWVSQGTGAAGTSFNTSDNLSVAGNTIAGVLSYTTTAGVTNFSAIGLPGSTAQYVRGDGSLATLPGGGGSVSSVAAGNGMSFTTITGSGSVTMGTPSTCSAATSNALTSTSHTHAISGFMPTTGGTFSGAITAPGVTDSSDIRFKRDVRTIRDGLDIIRSLSPVRFFNTLTEQHEVGFVAQEVRGVLPEVVSTDDNGDLAVAYQRIVAPIVAAMLEIDARLAAIEAR